MMKCIFKVNRYCNIICSLHGKQILNAEGLYSYVIYHIANVKFLKQILINLPKNKSPYHL